MKATDRGVKPEQTAPDCQPFPVLASVFLFAGFFRTLNCILEQNNIPLACN